jgi:hypothetical protein
MHNHIDLITAWADGVKIYAKGWDGIWRYEEWPYWDTKEELKQHGHGEPKKNAEIIKQWANGSKVQWNGPCGWVTIDSPAWDDSNRWQVLK